MAAHAGGVVLLTLFAVVVQVFVRGPLSASHDAEAQRAAEMKQRLHAVADTRQKHARLHERLRESQELAESVRRRIPEQPQQSQFLHAITAAADKYGMNIKDFAVGNVAERVTHYEVGVSFSSAGDFEKICRFLDAIMTMQRVVTLENLTIRSETDSRVYPFDVTLQLPFAIKDPEVRDGQEDSDAG